MTCEEKGIRLRPLSYLRADQPRPDGFDGSLPTIGYSGRWSTSSTNGEPLGELKVEAPAFVPSTSASLEDDSSTPTSPPVFSSSHREDPPSPVGYKVGILGGTDRTSKPRRGSSSTGKCKNSFGVRKVNGSSSPPSPNLGWVSVSKPKGY